MPPEQPKVDNFKVFKDSRIEDKIVKAILSRRRASYDPTRLLFSPLADPQNVAYLLNIITQIKLKGELPQQKAIPKGNSIFQVLLTAGIIKKDGTPAKGAQERLRDVQKLDLIYQAANGNYIPVGIYGNGVAYIDSDGTPAPDNIPMDQKGNTKSFEAILVSWGMQFYNLGTQEEQNLYSENRHFHEGHKQGDGEKNRSLACTLTTFDIWEEKGIGVSYKKLRGAEIIPRATLIDMALADENTKFTIDYTDDIKDAAEWRRWDKEFRVIVEKNSSLSAAAEHAPAEDTAPAEIEVYPQRPFTFSQIKGELDKCQAVDDDGVINTFDIQEKHIGVKSAKGSITFYQRFLRMFEALRPVLNKYGDFIVRVRVKRPIDPVWQAVCKRAGEKVFGRGKILILNKEEEVKATPDDAMVGAPIATQG